jgi:hypothetical protein
MVVMDWIYLAEDNDMWGAVVNAVMNFHVTENCVNALASEGPVSFSRRTLRHVASYFG